MPYIDPSKVNSPKHSWGENHEVLIDTGSGGWSAAEGTWENEPCLGLRWNGSDENESIGNPQSRGNPTWWIVPDELSGAIRREIELVKKSKGLVTCSITKPDGYQHGAWRIEAKLSTEVKDRLGLSLLPFNPPEMENRRCNPDAKYVRADENGLFSIFIDGVWYGHLYSNGISENANPVTIDAYKEAFIQSVTKAIAISGVMA
ncbi:hypothetical protein AAAA28_20400 [Providencia stuartii]|uniref:hypothetical protein n=1 Tax=Providencia stuartii TaxID=588 RepID=UPI0029EE1A6F|nr:hypothetical protein [Proteus mirabilis]